jgi:uncharacterized protein (DUF486 family)
MRAVLTTVGLLTLSNVFMIFAWYAHVRYRNNVLTYIM